MTDGGSKLSGARRLDVQGLRAVAVLLVVAFHAGIPGLSGGSVGVDVFFVISGLVIAGTLTRELERTGGLSLRGFYRRRIRRLWPALATMLVTVLLASVLLAPAGIGHTADLTGVAAALFSANFYLYTLPNGYFDLNTQLNPLLHTWTLGVEEQFYLFFPALLLLGWKLGGRRLAVGAVLAATVGSALLASTWSSGSHFGGVGSPATFGFYASPARAWEFGLGALLALAWPRVRPLTAPTALLLSLGGAGLVAAAATRALALGLRPGPTGIAAIGAIALIAAGEKSPAGRLLAQRLLVSIGDRSYSWYLWHWPLIVFARACFPGAGWAAPAAAALSYLPAWASYRWVENPIRFDPRVRGRVVLLVGVACLVLPLDAAAGSAVARHYLPNHPALFFASQLHADTSLGCATTLPYGSPSRPRHCTWKAPHARGTVVLIGDSNAGQFTEPVTAAAVRAGYDATVATDDGCPFAQLRVHYVHAVGDTCASFNQGSLRNLLRTRPSLVIIAARTNLYINEPARLGAIGATGWTRDPVEKERLFAAGLAGELRALTRQRIPVILVHVIPELSANPRNCAVLTIMLGDCSATTPRTAAVARVRLAWAAEDAAVRGLPVTTLNLEDRLCSATVCAMRPQPDDPLMYWDEQHLSVAGAETFTGAFYRAITAHARPRTRG